jgi:hypothetical protein
MASSAVFSSFTYGGLAGYLSPIASPSSGRHVVPGLASNSNLRRDDPAG